MKEKLIIIKGDLCHQEVGAIVNPANTDLLHGGGLAAAIVEAGGQIIQEESNNISPIPLGEAAVTKAGKLPCDYVIHAASMKLGDLTSEESLTDSLRNSFLRAAELNLSTIALPAIGAGIGAFPIEQCAKISLDEANKFLAKHAAFEKIIFVLHSDRDFEIFKQRWEQLLN